LECGSRFRVPASKLLSRGPEVHVLPEDPQLVRLDDTTLHENALRLASRERLVTEEILLHLREIDRRRIYFAYGVTTLHSYCTKILNYSEGSASRRVNAARLLGDLPEIAEKLRDGTLNLSNLSTAQTFIRAEEKRLGTAVPLEEKRELVASVENKTQFEAERLLAERLPDACVSRDRRRALANGEVEYSFVANAEFQANYQRALELSSHKRNDSSMLSLLNLVLQDYIGRHAPERKSVRLGSDAMTHSHAAAVKSKIGRQYISASVKKSLYDRSGSCCEWEDENGRCRRRHHLQIDHVIPVSAGGETVLANLQLLCRPHNLYKGPPRSRK
jgi:hypothetical protein